MTSTLVLFDRTDSGANAAFEIESADDEKAVSQFGSMEVAH